MIKHYGNNLILGTVPSTVPNTQVDTPFVTLMHTPPSVLGAIQTLFSTWPDLVTTIGMIDLPSPCFEFEQGNNQLTIRMQAEGCQAHGVECAPIHIAARFERAGDYLNSFSEMIRLLSMQTRQVDTLPLRFDVRKMGMTISEVIDGMKLRGKFAQHAALQLCLQLAFTFRVRTVGQLVLWLLQVLNPTVQTVTDAHTKSLIESFWHWSTPNFLYLIYEVLARCDIEMTEAATFLYYTKLITMMDDEATQTLPNNERDMRGRLKLPLVSEPVPNVVPNKWLRALAARAEAAREHLNMELVTTETEPSLWAQREG
jgi:hypothetical protein